MISKHPAIAAVVAAGALTVSLLPAGSSAAESAAAPSAAAASAPKLAVVAKGLNNPRGITVAPDGTLYVAEAGKGGTGPCQSGPEGQTCFGKSGSITRIRYGHKQRIVTGLPSLAAPDGTNASGPSDVGTDRRGKLSYLIGLGGSPDLRTTVKQLSGMAKLYEAARRGPKAVADVGAYEKTANPDNVAPPDTNPNGLAVSRSARYVVDAGGNTLLRVSDRGRVSTVAVFGPRTVKAPAGIPDLPAGTPVPMQSVPTAAVQGPDGAWYVAELTGFPFPQGGARIYRVVAGHRPQVYATGLTNVIDLAFGPRGRLYALEISHNGLLSGNDTGALLQVARNGKHRVVASTGLRAPGGVAIRGKNAYVTNCGTCSGTGSVVRIRL